MRQIFSSFISNTINSEFEVPFNISKHARENEREKKMKANAQAASMENTTLQMKKPNEKITQF